MVNYSQNELPLKGIHGVIGPTGLVEGLSRVMCGEREQRPFSFNESGLVSKGRTSFLVWPSERNVAGSLRVKIHGCFYWVGVYGSHIPEMKDFSKESESYLFRLIEKYIAKGPSFVEEMEWECSLALWDESKETVLLATDPCRINPIFYAYDHSMLVFSTRLPVVARILGGPALSLNLESVLHIIGSSYIPTPSTIFNEISTLSPGSVLTYCWGRSQIKKYWEIDFTHPSQDSVKDLQEELRQTFRVSLEGRVKNQTDPTTIGTFLSGGIDSSTVTGVLTEIYKQPINTFTIGFSEEKFNEVEFARIASRCFHSNHHEYFVTAEDTFNALPHLIKWFDQPFGNASSIPTYFCAKLAREAGVTTLFAGDGGDELFAGNERYLTQRIFDWYKLLPRSLRRRICEPWVDKLQALLPLAILTKAQKYIRRANIPYPDRLASWGIFEILGANQFLHPKTSEHLSDFNPNSVLFQHYANARATTELDHQLYIDLQLTIGNNDLVKVTTMTEAADVDVQFPFLSQGLMECAAKIPASHKLRGTQLRRFFKMTYSDLLPKEILRKKKHGFGLPVSYWLNSYKPLNDLMHDLLLGKKACQRGLFEAKTLRELINRHHQDDTSFYGSIIWNIMMFELWMHHFDTLSESPFVQKQE